MSDMENFHCNPDNHKEIEKSTLGGRIIEEKEQAMSDSKAIDEVFQENAYNRTAHGRDAVIQKHYRNMYALAEELAHKLDDVSAENAELRKQLNGKAEIEKLTAEAVQKMSKEQGIPEDIAKVLREHWKEMTSFDLEGGAE